MPERNGPGLIVIGLRYDPPGQVNVEAGNPTDIEYTKRQARNLVSGANPMCYYAWIAETIFEATPDQPPCERKA